MSIQRTPVYIQPLLRIHQSVSLLHLSYFLYICTCIFCFSESLHRIHCALKTAMCISSLTYNYSSYQIQEIYIDTIISYATVHIPIFSTVPIMFFRAISISFWRVFNPESYMRFSCHISSVSFHLNQQFSTFLDTEPLYIINNWYPTIGTLKNFCLHGKKIYIYIYTLY